MFLKLDDRFLMLHSSLCRYFPMVLYKKIMNRPIGLHDLKELDPQCAQGGHCVGPLCWAIMLGLRWAIALGHYVGL